MRHAYRVPMDGREVRLTVGLGVLLPLAIFGVLAGTVISRGYGVWDVPLTRLLPGRVNPSRDAVMRGVSHIGGIHSMALLVATVLALLLFRRQQAGAVFFLLAVGGALAINPMVKEVIRHLHPVFRFGLLPIPADGWGFPSGHATGPIAIATALALLSWRTRWRGLAIMLGGPVAAIVGISRVYLGVHTPSDVAGAWALSIAWVVGAHILYVQ